MRNILICAVGTSPAVLTETLWALKLNEHIQIDEVVILTTATGWERFQVQVRQSGVWDALCKTIKCRPKLTLEIFQNAEGENLEDLRTKEENLLAANQMLRVLRGITEEDDTCVFASIAGGRKTMSALFFSCMSLLGRKQDRVFHVLVESEYERNPEFFFPKNKKEENAAKIELFEVPFVRMRYMYQDRFKKSPPSYKALVEIVEAQVLPKPNVSFDLKVGGQILIDGQKVRLSAMEMLGLIMLWWVGNFRAFDMYKIISAGDKPTRLFLWLDKLPDIVSIKEDDEKEHRRLKTRALSDVRKKLAQYINVERYIPKKDVSEIPNIDWGKGAKVFWQWVQTVAPDILG